MRTFLNIAFIQLLLSTISALLLAQMSWIGKLGISLFNKSYTFLKSPLESGAYIFTSQLFIILILHIVYRTLDKKIRQWICFIIFLLAFIGLGYTTYDFNEEFSHRILKTKFHFGAYLIWIGYMLTAIYYFLLPRRKQDVDTEYLEEKV